MHIYLLIYCSNRQCRSDVYSQLFQEKTFVVPLTAACTFLVFPGCLLIHVTTHFLQELPIRCDNITNIKQLLVITRSFQYLNKPSDILQT
jgi:hypothetical protein